MYINTLTFDLDAVSKFNTLPRGTWVQENTAILVVHGIGNQRPLETLDTFARGLLGVYLKQAQHDPSALILEHRVALKTGPDGNKWFDNFIRFRSQHHPHHIDVYEYFWANYPEDQVSVNDMQKWVEHTARGAADFYDQKVFAEKHGDSSLFITDQKFDSRRYATTLWLALQVIPSLTRALHAVLDLARMVPFIGGWASRRLDAVRETFISELTSVAGDVVAYNTMDRKARLFEVRNRVLNGAVEAIRYLIEPQPSKTSAKKGRHDRAYGNVIVAAHSLGTQISFDAINRLSHLISQGEIAGVAPSGDLIGSNDDGKKKISDVLNGYATFGSPLDKIAFFFRDRTKKEEFLRRQILQHYQCFKEKDWSGTEPDGVVLNDEVKACFFSDIQWRNYFDTHDPVSGRLDYYDKVENIHCQFVKADAARQPAWWEKWLPIKLPFTHSYYWSSEAMFADIVANLVHRVPAKRTDSVPSIEVQSEAIAS